MADHSAEDFIERLARTAESVGYQAGVSATETAGQIISFLAAHPDWLGAFMKGGWYALPECFWERGCLSWQAINGDIVTPEDYRLSKIVAGMRPTP